MEILKMAKVVIEVDTETNKFSVKINDKAVKDAESASVYCCKHSNEEGKEEKKVYVSVNSYHEDESKVKTYTNISAAKSKEDASALPSEFEGFVYNPLLAKKYEEKVSTEKAKKDILNFFKKNDD